MNSSLEFECQPLKCFVTIQEKSSNGSLIKSVSYKDVVINTGRNENKEVCLQFNAGQVAKTFVLKNINVHGKFTKEGKASIEFKDRNCILLLSNAPPSNLRQFLKFLQIKFMNGTKQKFYNSFLPKVFTEISPITLADIKHSSLVNVPITKSIPAINSIKRKPLACLSNTPNKRHCPDNQLVPTKKPSLGNVILPLKLSEEQKDVLNAVLSKKNIFFTGTGKSFLLKRILGILPPDVTFATASTGVAASQINGVTLHSFAGAGGNLSNVTDMVKKIQKNSLILNQWRKCQHLIVDEISMISGEMFSNLEKAARILRNSDKPFGGIQLILSGDFFQLPPVAKFGEQRQFCFESKAWDNCIGLNLELQKVYRQEDSEFIEILNMIRKGRCPSSVASRLKSTSSNVIEKDGIMPTRLCTHKDDVASVNAEQLKILPGKAHFFKAVDSDEAYTSFLNLHTPVSEILELKVGSQVMLLKNLELSSGLVNGSRGVVIKFQSDTGYPVVKFRSNVLRTIGPEKWSCKSPGGLQLARKQVPLKLAWALSVHKSQGMTLDCVEMSLSRVFETGQAYVALSRARSLDTVRILDFSASAIRAHPAVLKYFSNLDV